MAGVNIGFFLAAPGMTILKKERRGTLTEKAQAFEPVPNLAAPAKALLLFRRLLAFFDRGAEVADAFTEALAEFGEAARPEDEQGDREDDENFGQTQFAKHITSGPKASVSGARNTP